MKTIGASLDAHLALETTTLATCWKVTRTDGFVFGFTDHDRDLTVSSVTYEASTGYTRSAIQSNSDLRVDNLDLEGMFDSASITEADLRAGRWDFASIEIFIVNWNDVSQGTLPLRKGKLGEVSAGRNRYTAELRGLTQFLQQDIGRVFSAADDVDVGDARHDPPGGVAAFTFSGAVTSVTDARQFNTNLVQANGYFDGGKITFTGSPQSLNHGLSMEVKTYLQSGGAIVLQLPMPYTVSVGNTFSIIAGYDKSVATALSKFNDVVNFRSYPYVPGTDQMVSGGL